MAVRPHHSQSHTNHKRKRPAHDQDQAKQAINPLKKRRRDLTRLLEHSENLPADVRIGYERELASCNFDLEAAEKEAKRSQMIKKYHMVRFFERKKATRAVKKAQQALAQAPDDQSGELQAQLHGAEVDLNYTLYYPLEVAYVSLYADKDKKDKSEDAAARTHPMWKVVEEAMEQGRLQDLRNGRYPVQGSRATLEKHHNAGDSMQGSRSSQKGAKAQRESKHVLRKPMRRKEPNSVEEKEEDKSGSDDEDGVGFFET